MAATATGQDQQQDQQEFLEHVIEYASNLQDVRKVDLVELAYASEETPKMVLRKYERSYLTRIILEHRFLSGDGVTAD